MLDTLIVAVVMCVDTCNWKLKQKFEYEFVQIEIQNGIKRGIIDVQEKSRKNNTFYWHTKEIITFPKNKNNEKIGNKN